MIGNPEWFTYRIFGWGVAPKTWQGWVYVAVVAAAIGFSLAFTVNTALYPWVFAILIGILMLDVMHIMMQLPKVHDERENMHQLIIERNVSFAAVMALVGIAIYQAYQNRALVQANQIPFDFSLLVIFGAMLATKIISALYVKFRL